jgi:acetyl esterase/lipase
MPYGITHAPLAFDPPLAEGETLAAMDMPSPGEGLVPYKVQAEPARKLPALSQMPILVVTAEASWMAADNHAIVHFLAQAGADVAHLRLENAGIHGNGHAMQLEKNSDEVATVIEAWLTETLD